MKIKKIPTSETTYQYLFVCPGCDEEHAFNETTWTFNQNYDLPTISPSFLMKGYRSKIPFVCHSFIVDGKIQYLLDCTHKLAGLTIDLPDIF